MAKGLSQVVGSEADGTAEMIMVVDQMFDCLNVSSCSEGIRKRKPSKEFVKNTQALRVCGNLPTEIKGNCRGSNSKRVLTFDKENIAPLTKRRRKH